MPPAVRHAPISLSIRFLRGMLGPARYQTDRFTYSLSKAALVLTFPSAPPRARHCIIKHDSSCNNLETLIRSHGHLPFVTCALVLRDVRLTVRQFSIREKASWLNLLRNVSHLSPWRNFTPSTLDDPSRLHPLSENQTFVSLEHVSLRCHICFELFDRLLAWEHRVCKQLRRSWR